LFHHESFEIIAINAAIAVLENQCAASQPMLASERTCRAVREHARACCRSHAHSRICGGGGGGGGSDLHRAKLIQPFSRCEARPDHCGGVVVVACS
jgi:hypothetical protein